MTIPTIRLEQLKSNKRREITLDSNDKTRHGKRNKSNKNTKEDTRQGTILLLLLPTSKNMKNEEKAC